MLHCGGPGSHSLILTASNARSGRTRLFSAPESFAVNPIISSCQKDRFVFKPWQRGDNGSLCAAAAATRLGSPFGCAGVKRGEGESREGRESQASDSPPPPRAPSAAAHEVAQGRGPQPREAQTRRPGKARPLPGTRPRRGSRRLQLLSSTAAILPLVSSRADADVTLTRPHSDGDDAARLPTRPGLICITPPPLLPIGEGHWNPPLRAQHCLLGAGVLCREPGTRAACREVRPPCRRGG